MRVLVASHDTEHPIREAWSGLLVDIGPSRVNVIFLPALECIGCTGVLSGEDIAKRLRVEATKAEHEIKEFISKSAEAGEDCGASVEEGGASSDADGPVRAQREVVQEERVMGSQ